MAEKAAPKTWLPDHPAGDYDHRLAYVRRRCSDQVDWYVHHSQQEMFLDKLFVIGVVLLSGLTPVLILWTSVPKPLQALPSALAAIAAGVAGSFNWKDNWVRWKATQEQLKSELSLFDVSAGTYKGGGAAALNIFALRVEDLSNREWEQWRAQQMELAKSLAEQAKQPGPASAPTAGQHGEG
jgi:hypothetical protein